MCLGISVFRVPNPDTWIRFGDSIMICEVIHHVILCVEMHLDIRMVDKVQCTINHKWHNFISYSVFVTKIAKKFNTFTILTIYSHPQPTSSSDFENSLHIYAFPTRSTYIETAQFNSYQNPLWPSDAVWRRGSGSTLARVMVFCLTAPGHYLNQCWRIANGFLCHSPNPMSPKLLKITVGQRKKVIAVTFFRCPTVKISVPNVSLKTTLAILLPQLPGANGSIQA